MVISKSFVELLLKLADKQTVPIGQFKSKKNKDVLSIFLSENVLLKLRKHNTFEIYCNNVDLLNNFVREKFGIQNLKEYYHLLCNSNSTKADSAKIASNSKLKDTRVYSGFFIRAYERIISELNSETLNLLTPPGSSQFISNYENFNIPDDITIIGVENPETFFQIENYKNLFKKYRPLFLLRFNNKSFIDWLQKKSNQYVHFGDIDLSGIAIYILEYRNKLNPDRCKFLIPDNIEALIKESKNYKDYEKQLNDPRVKGINFNDFEEIKELAIIIMKYRKTIEQESLKGINI
jgi:hypothetical protein